MNGLTKSELKMLDKLRQMQDLTLAKSMAIKWINANKKRKTMRLIALRVVKNIFAHLPKENGDS